MSHHESPTRTLAPPRLPGTPRLGAVHLTVSGLDRSVAFLERLGFLGLTFQQPLGLNSQSAWKLIS